VIRSAIALATADLVPATHFLRPGFATLLRSPGSRGGRSAEKRSGAAAPVGHAMTRHARRLARRLASHNAGRSPLGAPPWRFFTRGRASVSGIASGSVQRAPRSQVVVPGGRLPGPPEASGYKPPPQDATPRSAFRIVSRRRPSMSKAGNCSSIDTLRSQAKYSGCSQWVDAAGGRAMPMSADRKRCARPPN
jgi:hypothetical protein